MQAIAENARKGGNGVIVKRMIYLAMAALAAVLILAPVAMAQDVAPGDDDPYSPEQNVVVVEHEELQRIAGQPLPQQRTDPPATVPDETLAQTGGPAILLPAALLVGSGVLLASYAALRRRRR